MLPKVRPNFQTMSGNKGGGPSHSGHQDTGGKGRRRTLSIFVFALLGLLIGLLTVSDPYLMHSLLDRDARAKLALPGWPVQSLFVVALPLSLGLGAWLFFQLPAIWDWILENADLIIVAGFFFSHQLKSFEVGPIDPTDTIVMVGIGLGFSRLICGKSFPIAFSPIYFCLIGMVIILFCSLALNPQGFTVVARAVKAVLLFVLLVCYPMQRDCIPRTIRILLVMLPITAVFCIIQEIVWLVSGVLLIGPIDKGVLETMFEFGMFRVCGLTNFYTVYGLAAGTLFLVTYSLTIFRNEIVKGWGWKCFCWISMALTLVAIFFTTAKDIWIGCFVGVALMTVVRFWRLLPVCLPIALLIAAAACFAFEVMPGRENFFNYVLKDVKMMESERISLDRGGFEAIANSDLRTQLFGRGPGTAGLINLHPRNWPPHNAFIITAVEGGIPCMLLFIFFYLWALYRCGQLIAFAPDDTTRALGLGFLASWGVIFFYSNFQTTFLDPYIVAMFAVIEITAIQMLRQIAGYPRTSDTILPEFTPVGRGIPAF